MRKCRIVLKAADESEHNLSVPCVPCVGDQVVADGILFEITTRRIFNNTKTVIVFGKIIKDFGK
jgi:hypothetical protein